MDALAIGDALALKYASLTASGAPAGQQTIRASTCRLPNAIPTSPWVLVMLDHTDGTLQPGAVDYDMEWHATLHYSKVSGDLKRDTQGLLAWHGILWGATWSGMTLGLAPAGVRKAYTTDIRLVTATYAGEEWYGWDCTVIVNLNETTVLTP